MSEQLPDPAPLAAELERCPDPAGAGPRLLRLIAAAGPAVLAEAPEALGRLLHVLSLGPFLADQLVRTPGALAVVLDEAGLVAARTPAELAEALATEAGEGWRRTLLRRQRRELLRIVTADLSGGLGGRQVTEQLSRLAEVVLGECLRRAAPPQDAAALTVLALGKLGGEELNVSSDVDLVFVSAAPDRVEAATRAARALCGALAAPEGLLYRVDVRLRPWGGSGPLVVSAHRLADYLSRQARPWERQAMLRARPVAGDLASGEAVLQQVAPLLLADAPGVRARVRAEKEAIERRAPALDVKLAPGGIRDVEFIVQALQVEHGGRHPEVLTGNTLSGLDRLALAGLLAAEDVAALAERYGLLRDVEHRLQLADYRQVHTLPADPGRQAVLARSLGLSGGGALTTRLRTVMREVRAVFDRMLPP